MNLRPVTVAEDGPSAARAAPTTRLLARRVEDGTLLAALALLAFLILWGSVLAGRRVLLAGDILESFPPWLQNPPPHSRNPLLADPVTQFWPWLTQVRHSLLHGHLPLWSDAAFSGAPLLANQQSATFSPFTALALPFTPTVGYSLAMLAKLWVAGCGMAVFLRLLGGRGVAAVTGGLAYATCSFMVVWLGHPHTAVMALLVWGFAAAEWYVRGLDSRALAALAAVIGLQFLAGHAETSLHLGLALGCYAGLRAATRPERRAVALAGIALAGVLGTLLAGIQLLPFLADLRASPLYSERINSGAGFAHLQTSELISWLIPNGHGDPGVDGLLGRPPNYNESTGFAGVAILLLAPLGGWWLWRRARSAAVALGGITLTAAGVVYGPLSGISGHLPLLATANGARSIVVVCFGVAALGGLGLEALLSWQPRRRLAGVARVLASIGGAGLSALVVAAFVVLRYRGQVDGWIGSWHGNIGFWVAVAGVSILATAAFVASGLLGERREIIAAGLGTLVLAEAVLFAGPFQPKVPRDEVPPPSPALTWLQSHAGESTVSASGLSLIPNQAALYGLHDSRGYDLFLSPRLRDYWQHADPGYHDEAFYTLLAQPGIPWLAAAGVRYFVTAPGGAPLGMATVYVDGSAQISEVPGARPFAYSTVNTISASDQGAAIAALTKDPLGAVVVEGGTAAAGGSAAATRVTRRDPGAVDVDIDGPTASTLVVLQSYDADWTATVDGAITDIRPADVEFQSVRVPSGHHVVELRYSPRSVQAGAVLSILGVAGITMVLLSPRALPWWRHRRSPATRRVAS